MFSLFTKFFHRPSQSLQSTKATPKHFSCSTPQKHWYDSLAPIQGRYSSTFFQLDQHKNKNSNLSDAFFRTARNTQHTILQFTDLHHYNNGSKEDAEGIQLIRTISERVKPDLVVFTGDIIDGRYCKSYECFRNVVSPLVDQKIPWTYVPGNHDDETNAYTRKDLLKILSLPFCASRGARSFTHNLRLGPMQIYLIDSNGYVKPNQEMLQYDHIKQEQIDWYTNTPSDAEIGLAFFHIPFYEYKKVTKILAGHWGEEPCIPHFNSGFFTALRNKRDVHAVFVGHDHWNDFVGDLDNVWLCYGRVSGYTNPTVYGNSSAPANKERGARVIRYHSESKVLSTWLENKKGIEKDTIVSKGIPAREVQRD